MWVLLGTTLLVALILAFGKRLGWWRTLLAIVVLAGLLVVAADALARVLADTLSPVARRCQAQVVLSSTVLVPAHRYLRLVPWRGPAATSHHEEDAS